MSYKCDRSSWWYNHKSTNEDHFGAARPPCPRPLSRLSSRPRSALHRWHQQSLPHLLKGSPWERSRCACWSWMPQILRLNGKRLLAMHLLGCPTVQVESHWMLISEPSFLLFIHNNLDQVKVFINHQFIDKKSMALLHSLAFECFLDKSRRSCNSDVSKT